MQHDKPVDVPASEPCQAVVIPRDQHNVSRRDMSRNALRVLRRLEQEGHTAYLVGGAVRDLLLGREPKDFDVATDARVEDLKRIFRNSRIIGRRFRLAHIFFHGEVIECSTFRALTDPEEDQAHQDFHAVDGLVLRDNIYGTPSEDARRRDFTVNALFYSARDFTILDYVGAMEDIQARLIRCIGDPLVRYTEDPVRMIRAVRFAAALDFTMDPPTYQAILERREQLALASSSRLFDEIQKLFFCRHAERVVALLHETGLFEILFPELGAFVREHPEERDWVLRCARQFDVWLSHGMEVHAPLMIALLFGPLHEYQAQELIASGAPQREALGQATADHLRRFCERIRVPKSIIYHIADIMAAQSRFRTPGTGKRLDRFRKRDCFQDGLIYFKMLSRHTGAFAQEVAWWEEHGR